MKNPTILRFICFIICVQLAFSFETKIESDNQNQVSNSTEEYLTFADEYEVESNDSKKNSDETVPEGELNSPPKQSSTENENVNDNKENTSKEEDDQPKEDESYFVEKFDDDKGERDMINDQEENARKTPVLNHDEVKATTQTPIQKSYVIETTTLLEDSITTTTKTKEHEIIHSNNKHQQIKCSFGEFMIDIQGLFDTIIKTECDDLHTSLALKLQNDHFFRLNFTISTMGDRKIYKLNRAQFKKQLEQQVFQINDNLNKILKSEHDSVECISRENIINQQNNFTLEYEDTKIIVRIKCSESNDSTIKQSAQNDDSNSGHSFYLVLGSCFAILIIFSIVGFILKKYCMPRAERYEQVKF